MRNPLSVFVLLVFFANLSSQNPHGMGLKIDCASCHSPERWSIGADYWKTVDPGNPQTSNTTSPDEVRFHHGKTTFELTGQHAAVDCRSCHETLVFSKAASDCISCHIDMHQQTVGMDCARCHNTSHWLVDNITQLHVENGFPLLGRHAAATCTDCHLSETGLQFHRIGNDCINCHRENYLATTAPNHIAAGYSTDCVACHDIAANDWFWVSGGANHLFFPLTKGHQINDCTQCHIGGNFANTPTDWISGRLPVLTMRPGTFRPIAPLATTPIQAGMLRTIRSTTRRISLFTAGITGGNGTSVRTAIMHLEILNYSVAPIAMNIIMPVNWQTTTTTCPVTVFRATPVIPATRKGKNNY